MYQKHFKKRPFSNGPSRFARGKSSGHSKRGGQYIDPSRFINKMMSVEETGFFTPEHRFSDFKIDEKVKKAIEKKGYIAPTPIQDRAIPHILNYKDIVGIADTGTGKTAAFLIPLINKTLVNEKENVLIVVPTRELALQIDGELKSLIYGMKIFSVCCVGGASIGAQISSLRFRNNFIIGTPGRLKDLIERRKIQLSGFNTIVLDEADRMLDMGFVADMRYLVKCMPVKHHTLFFSATLSREVEKLIGEFLFEPVRISIKTRDTSKNVEQDIVRVKQGKNKLDMLHDFLNQKEFNKVLIFGRTKHGVERLSKTLLERGFKSASIHGNKTQSQRQHALAMFKENRIQVLVATDVAARGLDIVDVSHVINYDIPMTYDDYVHRVGRTGRGDKKGKALTFIE